MLVELSVKGVDVESIFKDYVQGRMHFALSRFGSDLKRVVVQLANTGGPEGTPQNRCQVSMRLLRGESLSVVATHGDLFVAIDRAVERASQSVRRRLLNSRCLAG
jgi:putative sigma-54 modulation protein